MVIARSAMDGVPLWQSVLLQPEDEYLLFETSKTPAFCDMYFCVIMDIPGSGYNIYSTPHVADIENTNGSEQLSRSEIGQRCPDGHLKPAAIMMMAPGQYRKYLDAFDYREI